MANKVLVTPFVGVWIETYTDLRLWLDTMVTPFVGVWIETKINRSLPISNSGHTLRGCVD